MAKVRFYYSTTFGYVAWIDAQTGEHVQVNTLAGVAKIQQLFKRHGIERDIYHLIAGAKPITYEQYHAARQMATEMIDSSATLAALKRGDLVPTKTPKP